MERVINLNEENAPLVASFMNRIKPEWWPTAHDGLAQLTDVQASIDTVGWYLENDQKQPTGWVLFRELKAYNTLELECCGYDDQGVFKLEHKLEKLFEQAENYARSKGYTMLRTGMSTVDFTINGEKITDVAAAMNSLETTRIDYSWLLDWGFQVIGIQPNVYGNNCHMIILTKSL
ncbi:hypothetical protein [Enterococcus sp. LJL51]|uniref:hypothetical protein n=1 Tax=Enterococcus sp. LJL51 TaxID=3416656 RepID=UPI003CEFB634